MNKSKYMNGAYAVTPKDGEDGFLSSRFPKMKIVEKKKTLMAVNRLFRSQTAFMPVVEEENEAWVEESQNISVNSLCPKTMVV